MESVPDTASPAVGRHIFKLWPRNEGVDELIAASEHVRALLEHPGWEVVQRVVGAEIETIDRSLDTAHKALDQADYALMHGRRGGLRAVTEAAHAIVSRAEETQSAIDDHEARASEHALAVGR